MNKNFGYVVGFNSGQMFKGFGHGRDQSLGGLGFKKKKPSATGRDNKIDLQDLLVSEVVEGTGTTGC
jgi:hypothetical protein